MTRHKLSPCEAKAHLMAEGIDFNDNYFGQRSGADTLLLAAAKKAGYRRRPNAPGSLARMFFQHIKRAKCASLRGASRHDLKRDRKGRFVARR